MKHNGDGQVRWRWDKIVPIAQIAFLFIVGAIEFMVGWQWASGYAFGIGVGLSILCLFSNRRG